MNDLACISTAVETYPLAMLGAFVFGAVLIGFLWLVTYPHEEPIERDEHEDAGV
jgi:hypothetical protein